jgi:hypothetical protein
MVGYRKAIECKYSTLLQHAAQNIPYHSIFFAEFSYIVGKKLIVERRVMISGLTIK